jgi:hypothetical protein
MVTTRPRSASAFAALLFLAACSDPPPTTVTRATSLAPGDICAAGGVKIESGVDDDGDRVLDASEVDTVDYICNGANGLTPIVVVSPEPVGIRCALGGQKVEVGLDDDRDGELDPLEVDKTTWICDGNRALIHVRPEPPGANCPGGGLRIDAGADDDLDGILDADEVDSTAYQCVLVSCVDDAPCGIGFCVSGFCYTDPALLCGNAQPGDTRPCERANGFGTCAGVETCDGTWFVGCDAPLPAEELCADGVDNDCDGLVDGADACSNAVCTSGERQTVEECMGLCPDPGCLSACFAEGGLSEPCQGALQQLFICAMGSSCLGLPDPDLVLQCAAERCPSQTELVFGSGGPAGCTPEATEPCGGAIGACVSGTRTCDAGGHWGACEGAVGPADESCNAIDDDCNGIVDDNPVTGGGDYFIDHDRDGFGAEPIVACGERIGDPSMEFDLVASGGDCADWEPSWHPGAPAICAWGADADCSGTLDYLELTDCAAGGCGDGWCDAALGEDPLSCNLDCNPCGDGTCQPEYSEDRYSCRADCLPSCGNGACELGLGEDLLTCFEDCPASCGDGTCHAQYGETEGSCYLDCLVCAGELAPCPTGCEDVLADPRNCGLCGNDCGPAACVAGNCSDACGNGICAPAVGEDAVSCPADCQDVCGDAVCGPTETNEACPGDCPIFCPDGFCDPLIGESSYTCPADCPDVCGDATCGPSEDPTSCYEDCPADCPSGACEVWYGETAATCAADCLRTCGDGVCDLDLGFEDPGVCPTDCPAFCGDGWCDVGEQGACSADCPLATCGDGTCSGGEDLMSCLADCSVCGDDFCASPAEVSGCPTDCPTRCGDGYCHAPEVGSCAADCG